MCSSDLGPREMMKVLGELSAYIGNSVHEGHSIWIAQKEGRAKNGDDKTDPAILKMFYVDGKKQKIAALTEQADALKQQVAALEKRCDEQDAAIRRILGLLIDWVEQDDQASQPAARGRAA